MDIEPDSEQSTITSRLPEYVWPRAVLIHDCLLLVDIQSNLNTDFG